MITRRHRARRTASLTPLLDVLFILLFASLIQAHAAVERGEIAPLDADEPSAADTAAEMPPDAGPADASVPDASPPDAAPGQTVAVATTPDETRHLLRSRDAARELARTMGNMEVYEMDLDANGQLLAMFRNVRDEGGESWQEIPSDAQFWSVDHVAADGRTLCDLVRQQFDLEPDADRRIVYMVTLTESYEELHLAKLRGLKQDIDRCYDEIGAVGIVIDPGKQVREREQVRDQDQGP